MRDDSFRIFAELIAVIFCKRVSGKDLASIILPASRVMIVGVSFTGWKNSRLFRTHRCQCLRNPVLCIVSMPYYPADPLRSLLAVFFLEGFSVLSDPGTDL